ncbi:MAG: tRNA epoxyqueuosine(34) reductase QueG [Pseudomonadota bacterium]
MPEPDVSLEGAVGDQKVMSKLQARIRRRAIELGADAIGFVSLADASEAISVAGNRLEAFVAYDRHGDMHWLADTLARRRAPNALWPDAKSAIVIGQSYAPTQNPLEGLAARDKAIISAYARGRDYHDVLKGRLKVLGGEIGQWTGEPLKVFVDTAPLMEKPLAELAGIGWQGKHTNLVSRAHGSWLFLGIILSAADFKADEAHTDHCGACTRCLDICPTKAFPAPYQLDARKCLAYWSIEAHGPIPHAFRKPMANRVFGCDDCLAVCPWNKFATATREAKYAQGDALVLTEIGTLLKLDDNTFRKRFAGTPVKRTGRARFIRNVAIAAGNSGNAEHTETLRNLTCDDDPRVRGASVWALAQLMDRASFADVRTRREPLERDPAVREEWALAALEDAVNTESSSKVRDANA